MDTLYILLAIALLITLYILINSVINAFSERKKLMIENPELQKEISQLNSKIEHIKVKLKKENIQLEKEFEKKSKLLNTEIEELQKKVSFLLNGINEKDTMYKSLSNKTNENISKITSLYSDLLLVQYSISEKYLITKKHPAIEEAKRIKELKKETKIHIERYRQMVYIYESLLQLFPELTNYVDDFETIQMLENSKSLEIFIEDFDKVQYYLSKEEYKKLNEEERNQMALDRYVKGQKSKWQIGRDYELYCGIEYEKDNWNVEYIGMEKKLEDMGRDLIAIKGAEIHVVQCKYWAQHKVIHEKHIAQLFGTTIAYKIEKGELFDIIPVFMTNIELSKKAKEFAIKLNVVVVKKEMGDFPRIKCNYGKNEYGVDTKIYHLPFDQQYDKIKMNRSDNFYTYNVREAIDKGFRRAFKYYGK